MSAPFDPVVAEQHLSEIVGPAVRLCGELASIVDRDRAADATMRVAAVALLYRRVQRDLLSAVNADQRTVLVQWFSWIEQRTAVVLQELPEPDGSPPFVADEPLVALTEDPTLFDIDAWDTPTKEGTDG